MSDNPRHHGVSACCGAELRTTLLSHGAYACCCSHCGEDTSVISRAAAQSMLDQRLREAQYYNRNRMRGYD